MTHHRLLPLAVLACILAVPSFGAPDGKSKVHPGLLARFGDDAHWVTAVTPNPNFAVKADESIDPRLTPEFSAEWTGSLNVTKRGTYTFKLDGAERDATMLVIDRKSIGGGPVELEIGEHPIRIQCIRPAGRATRQELLWSSDDFLAEPVPEGAFTHREEPGEEEAWADADADAGRLLVESLNCVACHQSAKSKGIVGRRAPDLTTAGSRLKSAWVATWLEDPHAFRSNAMMPRVPLTADQRKDAAAFLATLKSAGKKLKEETTKPPEHVSHGRELFGTVGCAACHTAPDGKDDIKKFSLRGIGSKWLTGQLGPYLENPLAVDHSGRMPSMLLSHEDARDLAEYLTESHDPKFEGPKETSSPSSPPTTTPTSVAATAPIDPAVERGREVVRSQGCVQCHAIRNDKETPAAIEGLTTLEQLDLDNGCLAEHPRNRAVDYHLSTDQRRLIIAFVRSIRSAPLITAAPTAEFYHKVATFGCTNCHELDTLKPADQIERIPMLTNVGARLRKDWIREVLTQKKRVRPWLHRRMPEFGGENVGDLADLAVAVAGAGDADPLPKPTKDEILTAQRVTGIGGEGSLGCVTCHGFNGVKPQVADDTRGPDLNTVASRLRPDHFRRWVYDPKRVNPATPMPSFFDGTPRHDAMGTIDTILAYCALGNSMPPPVGWVDENNYTLAVRDKPIVMRAVMPTLNGGHNFPRGIAVGLPGLVSYCFDADSCMTRYAWSGAFVDMRAAWSGRGGNQIQVTGKRFWATDTPPLHVGAPEDPEPKPQFEGYTLDAQGLPTWLYRLGEVEVKETITATDKGYGIVRKFEVDAHGEPVTLRLVEHPQETEMYTSLPSIESTQLQPDPKKDAKLPALTAKLGDGSHITFTVTLLAKEEK